MKLDNRFEVLQLEPGCGDVVNNAIIGRDSRLELTEEERRGAEQPVLDTRVSQERVI